jgi:uncharacterized protein with NRDE domain
MCTLAVYLRQFENYPLVIAANRDEHFSRPSAPPQTLSNEPVIFGGKDLVAGGTWLGVNEHGLAAGVVNRRVKAAHPADTPRSRGLLCLDMLRAENPAQARALLDRKHAARYQPFLLLIASAENACVAFNSESEIERIELKAGVHVFGNTSFTNSDAGKLAHAHGLFSTASISLYTQLQRPASQLESAVGILRRVLSDHATGNGSQDPRDSICVHAAADYGTVSSSIVFYAALEREYRFYHASGAPCRANYEALPPVKLS